MEESEKKWAQLQLQQAVDGGLGKKSSLSLAVLASQLVC
jgi:hypothetical protein